MFLRRRDSRTIRAICEDAARVGSEIDLTGCDYGPHKGCASYFGPAHYYPFLAGFARTLDMRKILEIGTSYGGSIMAFSRGCRAGEHSVKMVTVDKVDMAGPGVKSLKYVKRLHGNSLATATMKEVRKYLKRPIDLLFIDSKHSYEHVTRNISIYGAEFRPRFIILDDIELDAEMKRAWAEIAGQYAEHAFDASALARRLDTGFGVLDCRKVDKYHLIAAGDRIP